MSNGVFHSPLSAPASHQLVPTDPSCPAQNTSMCSGVRATTVTWPWADPAGAMSNGVFHSPLLAPASHQLVPTDPSCPTQSTTMCSGVRATTVTWRWADPAGAMSNGVFHSPLLAPASHQLVSTDPSCPTQNTSMCSGVRATTVTTRWADPAGAISNGVFHSPLLAPASHQLVSTDPSCPTQNTSICSGVRATTVTTRWADPTGAISHGVFHSPLLTPASHQLVPTDPSCPTQNTSICSGVRATASGPPSFRSTPASQLATLT